VTSGGRHGRWLGPGLVTRITLIWNSDRDAKRPKKSCCGRLQEDKLSTFRRVPWARKSDDPAAGIFALSGPIAELAGVPRASSYQGIRWQGHHPIT